ncbi:GTPase [Deinococcus sp. QL22]|uniref:GTPase n=1 Tax=Deinococcus sp. QL22 TaxID=2939437 RepID=UPI0020172474|nr:GTPase [Deinococcus sp. QL22]UQN08788.1 50S ribosome-binding GTPase [Deinococcus sp. QL22]
MNLEDEAAQLRQDLEEADRAEVRVAVFGQPGAGKSSLVNAILGVDEAVVGVHTDTTTGMSSHSTATVPGVEFCDLPGYGTARFPKETYFKEFKVDSFDVYLCVSSGKIVQSDAEFFRYLITHSQPCVFVVNQHDQLWQKGKTTEQLEEEKIADIQKQVGLGIRVIFTSCRPDRDDNLKGIDEVKDAVLALLDDVKADRWRRSMQAKTEASLEAKKAASKRRVLKASMLAVVNGALNIIPGLDIAVDMTVIRNMYKEIRRDYGLTEKDLDGLGDYGGSEAEFLQALLRAAFKAAGTTAAFKIPLKFVPIVGNIVSGTLSLGACVTSGNAYVDACHDLASKRLTERLRR